MRQLYKLIKEKVDAIDFTHLFDGFSQMPFALYDETHVYLASRVIKKTNQFYGNTSIQFEGKHIAIWYIDNKAVDDTDVLASKIIHEMFHAYQMKQKDPRFPNEILAVKYPYDARNLTIKFKEHTLISDMIDDFSINDFKTLCALKHYRKTHYKDAYHYESAIETIEGMAVYVELKALKQLNETKYRQTIDRLKTVLIDPVKIVPIRSINYTSGALLLLIADNNNIMFNHTIGEETRDISSLVCNHISTKDVAIPIKDKTIEQLVNTYKETVKVNIETKMKTYDQHLTGVFDIVGLDPMNTMFTDNTLYCKHILAYKASGEVHYIKQASVSRVNDQMQITEIFY